MVGGFEFVMGDECYTNKVTMITISTTAITTAELCQRWIELGSTVMLGGHSLSVMMIYSR